MLRNGGQRASDGCFFSPIFHSRLINLRAFAMALPRVFKIEKKSDVKSVRFSVLPGYWYLMLKVGK